MISTIRDITDPGEFLPDTVPFWQTWWFLCLAGLAVILIGTGLYFFFRKKPATKTRQTLLQQARQQLQALKSKAGQLPAETVAVRISFIIRQYLETAFDDPALFETEEEFTLRPQALSKLHPDSRQPISQHLGMLSQLKYAPNQSANNLTTLIDDTADLLDHIEVHVTPADATSLAT